MASKVYFMDARSNSLQTGLVPKMLTVFDEAGFDRLIRPYDVVAIKVHCGEWNNTAYLRPVYARALADRVKSLGGRPFVCDTTTLPYAPNAGRVTELDLLHTAERNGYSPAVLGCPFVCADGFMGTDDYRVELPEGFILKEAYIARAIAAADVLIVLTHFKGHPMGVIGGAIKNLGIGAQSKRGKFNVHMGGHPRYGLGASPFHPEQYKGGREEREQLAAICPFGLIHVTDDSIKWDNERCPNCLACLGALSKRGIIEISEENFQATCAAIADGCLATIKAVGPDRVGFINMAVDVSPLCDCVNYADMPLIPNLGVFAGSDPVALDKACLDKAMQATGMPGSISEEREVSTAGERKFETCSTLLAGISEEIQLNAGELIGLGTMSYELVEAAERPMQGFVFSPDPRPVGKRLRESFARMSPFPGDRHEGKGFLRKDQVDLESVNLYRGNGGGQPAAGGQEGRSAPTRE